MLRVLIVTSVFPRFAGDATPPFVWNAARELAAAGWEVTVLAPHGVGAAFHDRIPVEQVGVPRSRGPGEGACKPEPGPAKAGTPTVSASHWSPAFTWSRPPEHGFSNPCLRSRARTSSEDRSDDVSKTMSVLRWSPGFLRSRRNRQESAEAHSAPQAHPSFVEVIRFPYFWPLRLQQLCYEGGMLVNFRTRPWTKCLLPFFLTAQTAALLWLTLRLRPQILHSHSLLPQGLTTALVAALTGLPHITTSHGNDVFGLRPDGLMGRLKRWVLAQADAVTVNSSATEEAVRALGCEPAKVHRVPAVPNAVPPDPARVADIRARHVAGKEDR